MTFSIRDYSDLALLFLNLCNAGGRAAYSPKPVTKMPQFVGK
ncbi:hypothetical protein EYZ11_000956 [Aspergillus tanneri]|uniref:Uncharacterized protein n=1 Tax=Aspergillus tanneri TaxID=1220188 RepID=A0A4S3JVZ1_9EURO|nr:hypothetical protein EYZ11_000956 [Aspergillus tanneri]